MRARVALPAAMLVTLLALAPGTATAHSKVFQACAAFTSAARYCLESITIVRGDTVWLRVKVKPEHAGRQVVVQKRNPGRTNWDTDWTEYDQHDPKQPLELSAGGRAEISWTTGPDTVDEEDPYRFRFRIADHRGFSNSVAEWVFRP